MSDKKKGIESLLAEHGDAMLSAGRTAEAEARAELRKKYAAKKIAKETGAELAPEERDTRGRKSKHTLSRETIEALVASFKVASLSIDGEPNFRDMSAHMARLGFERFEPSRIARIWEAWKKNPTVEAALREENTLWLNENVGQLKEKLVGLVNDYVEVLARELDEIKVQGRTIKTDSIKSIQDALSATLDTLYQLSGVPRETTRQEINVRHEGAPPQVIAPQIFMWRPEQRQDIDIPVAEAAKEGSDVTTGTMAEAGEAGDRQVPPAQQG